MITISIDNQTIKCQEGESILDIARKNDIFIPAICYLQGCSPTVACRLCMVEADGKRVYSCNAKAKDGMNIQTYSAEIGIERQAIMRVYDINHPLECGVCDKSGECELQNYSLMMGVEHQEYAIKDTLKQKGHWGHALYDPNLCIVCERCVTACSDRVGDNNLSTTKRGSDMPDKAYKDIMPKDAFGTWTKLSKSLITSNGKDCGDCGECISVCPVGALGEDHFHYTSNAWELERIQSHCAHCPSACALTYEGKHGKMFRVTNDWVHTSLCGAGRYGWEVEFDTPKGDLHQTLEAFQKAQTISFGNFISNEEAYILQALKIQKGYRLYNPTAREFQSFLRRFMQNGNHGSTNAIKQSDVIITIGCNISHDIPTLKYTINNTLKMSKGTVLFVFHAIESTILENKNARHYTYKAGDEYNALLFLATLLLDESQQKSSDKDATTHQTPFGDVDVESFKALHDAKTLTLIAGSDIYHHPQSQYIADLLSLLSQKHNIILLPPEGNALGVALICDLDSQCEGYTIGFNKSGHYRLSSLPKDTTSDCTMPALMQQYGSITSLDRYVVPLLPAYAYNGLDLSDIAYGLGNPTAFRYKNQKRSLKDYTQLLPNEQGYLPITLEQLFKQKSVMLNPQNTHVKHEHDNKNEHDTFKRIQSFPTPHAPIHVPNDCILIYGRDPQSQFSPWTYSSTLLRSKAGLYVSNEFLKKWQLNEGEIVHLQSDSGQYSTAVFVDDMMNGEAAALSMGQFMRDEHPLFKPASRFAVVRIISSESHKEAND